jgi:predicted transposase YbfD/YdcC
MNDEPLARNLATHFGTLDDPRVMGRCAYPLLDLIVIAICASITGAESWVEVETFARTQRDWLSRFVDLSAGIPSHDTFGRVFALLDAARFHQCFTAWIQAVFGKTDGDIIAIDGKTSRRSHDKGIGKAALHLVSAWACGNGVVLGQVATDVKSNEITAIPELLRVLDVAGCIVTIDAMGTQKEIAGQIRQQEADYVLALKENQGRLYAMTADLFAYGDQTAFTHQDVQTYQTVSKDHGRIEIRRCHALSDTRLLASFQAEGWTDLQTLVRLQRERRFADRAETETAYFISSLPNDAARLLAATRSHWQIENQLHWVLDVVFREDDSRIRAGNAPENMAVLRHISLNILKKDKSKGSVRTKRYRAALDITFLEALLAQV